MKYFPLLLIAIILFFSCNSQPVNENSYNQNYIVGQIPDLSSFEEHNEYDKRMDSILRNSNEMGPGGFRNNRSRIFMRSFSNNKQASQDSALYKGMPAPCYSILDKDTLKIKMGIGFFGGMGWEIKVFKDQFQSDYFFYIDDVKPYKYQLSDTAFTDNLILISKFQSLTLNQPPSYKPGQQLTGYLTFTSPSWYEHSISQEIDTNYVIGKLYFTCATK